jgi:hypothetical protein
VGIVILAHLRQTPANGIAVGRGVGPQLALFIHCYVYGVNTIWRKLDLAVCFE